MNILFGITVLVSLASSCTALKDLGAKFYCSTRRSEYAKNVNELRPGDIKVVAALGDTPVAATGAGATTLAQINIDYRGLSFVIGGDKCLAEHISVPNVLKKFNPKVFGQSYGTGPVTDLPHAQLNVAVPTARAVDLLSQAKELVLRLYQMQSIINIKNDWKLIHIYIGGNDACYYCRVGPVEGISSNPCSYKAYVEQAVKYLYDNVPRAIVSIISMRTITPLNRELIDMMTPTCKAVHGNRVDCPCFTKETRVDPTKLTRDYQKAVLEIQNEGKYDKEDFTVVIQPTFENVLKPPFLKNGSIDTEFFAPDCTRISQYGNAILAKMVWNNLVQPVGSKVSNYSLSDPNIPLLCPKWSCPYIRTKKNSVNCTRPVCKHHQYFDSRSHERSRERCSCYGGKAYEEKDSYEHRKIYAW